MAVVILKYTRLITIYWWSIKYITDEQNPIHQSNLGVDPTWYLLKTFVLFRIPQKLRDSVNTEEGAALAYGPKTWTLRLMLRTTGYIAILGVVMMAVGVIFPAQPS